MGKGIIRAAAALLLLAVLSLSVTAAEGVFFSDVKESDWFAGAVYTARDMGLINGKGKDAAGQDYFDPEGNITLAEAVKLAACMNQLYTTGEVTLTGGDPWYESYADYGRAHFLMASEAGFSYESVMANPGLVLRRAEFAWIFARALPEEALPTINAVPDDAIPDMRLDEVNLTDQQAYLLKYYTEVYRLYRAGIVNGSDDAGTFRPESNIKRSEVAAIVVRMMRPEKRVGAPANLKAPSAGVTLHELYDANLMPELMKRHTCVTVRRPGESDTGTSYRIIKGSVVTVHVWDYTEDGVTVRQEQGTYGDFGYKVTPEGLVEANLYVSGSGHMPMDDVIASELPVELTEEIELLAEDGETMTLLIRGRFLTGPSTDPGEMTVIVDRETLELLSSKAVIFSEDYTSASEYEYVYDGEPVGRTVTEGWDNTRTIIYEIHKPEAEPLVILFDCPAAWDLTLEPMPAYRIRIKETAAEELPGRRFHISPGTEIITVVIE